MRKVFLALVLGLVLAGPLSVAAQEDEGEYGWREINRKLETLSKKIADLAKQNQTLLENQAKIFEELKTIRIMVRRT